MKFIGQLCLLVALLTSGYAAIVLLVFRRSATRRLLHSANICGMVALLSLTGAIGMLASTYSSPTLPWRDSLSALWAGPAGSLLLWAWALAGLSAVFRLSRTSDVRLRDCAFGVLLGNLAVIAVILVFAAHPFKPGLATPSEGADLSPLLQDPSKLIHPPVIFCAYAACAIPFALTVAALLLGKLDAAWTHLVRPWALFAWSALIVGPVLGAIWAHHEFGWIGDRSSHLVENAPILPWLTGTAFLYCLMAWRGGNCLKKTTVALGIGTFGLCYFATFLIHGSVFNGIQAFTVRPIGWMFLAVTAALMGGGLALLIARRRELLPERVAQSWLARESMIFISTLSLVTLALVVMASALVAPLSQVLLGRMIIVDPLYYSRAVILVGLVLLAATAVVPLLQWGERPDRRQRRVFAFCLAVGKIAASLGAVAGLRQFASVWVVGFATVAITAFVGAMILELRHGDPHGALPRIGPSLRHTRRRFAGYGAHLAIIMLAIGMTGSSLGTHRHDVENPMMPWLWFGGAIVVCCGLVAIWPPRRARTAAIGESGAPQELESVRRLAA